MTRYTLCFLLCLLLILPAAAQTTLDLDALPDCGFTTDKIEVGAVVVDFATGRGCVENLDTPMHIASVPKVFIAGAFLMEVARGNLAFDTTMVFTQDYFMGGRNACLTQDMVGSSLSYGYLSDIMITCSDNSATWMLMDVLGWENVQRYIDSLGIDGIGEVIPYSEVDRLKLTYLDARWANIPRGLASQFWRTRSTWGLVPNYFSTAPNYSQQQRLEASQHYFDTYTYNTATPRAIAEYMLKLRDDLVRVNEPQGQTAYWLFNTLILTQRQFSAQALPGTVYVGAKNGFDTGLRAELNLIFPSLWTLSPGAIAIVFSHQTEVNLREADDFGRAFSAGLSDALTALSPRITALLYPNHTIPEVSLSQNIAEVVVNGGIPINLCVPQGASLAQIEDCWQNLPVDPEFMVGQQIGLGVILRSMGGRTHRFSFFFTSPGGKIHSYQWTVAERDETHIFWFHPLDEAGDWTVDIYQNLQHVYSETVTVAR
jgi:hypothetical protein